MIRNALGKIGSVFNRGMATFNTRIFPKVSRGIGEAAKIGRNIGDASKAVRNIGSSINAISGNRLSPYADKANEIMTRIEGVGNTMVEAERPLIEGLNAVNRKINA